MRIVYGLAVPAWSDPRYNGFEITFTFIACFAAILVVECVTESVNCVFILITELSFSTWAKETKRPVGSTLSRRVIALAVQAGEVTIFSTVICGLSIAIIYALLFPKAHTDATDPTSTERGVGAWTESTGRAMLQFSIICVVALLMAVIIIGQIIRALSPFCRRAVSSGLFRCSTTTNKENFVSKISALRSPSAWIPLGRVCLFIFGTPFALLCLVPLRACANWLAQQLPVGHSVTLACSSITSICDRTYSSFWVCDWTDTPIIPNPDDGSISMWKAMALVVLGPGVSSWGNFLVSLSTFSAWYTIIWLFGGIILACEGDPSCPALIGRESPSSSVGSIIDPRNTCRTSSQTVSDSNAQLGPAVFGVLVLSLLAIASVISSTCTEHGPWIRAFYGQCMKKNTPALNPVNPDISLQTNSSEESVTPISIPVDNNSKDMRRSRVAALIVGNRGSYNDNIDEEDTISSPDVSRIDSEKSWQPSPLHLSSTRGVTARKLDRSRSLQDDSSIPCAVGSALLGLSIFAGFVSLCTAASPNGAPPTVGLALLGMCLFFAGSMFQRRPSKNSTLPTIVRAILSIVACIYAVFNASLISDTSSDDTNSVIVSSEGTWNNQAISDSSPGNGLAGVESYDVCSITKAGNSVLDYCVLATQAYRSTTSSAAQVGKWMNGANRSFISITSCLPRFSSDLVASYQRTGVFTDLSNLQSWECPGKLEVGLRFDAYYEPLTPLPATVLSLLSNASGASNSSIAPSLCSVDWKEIELLRGLPGRLFIVFRGTSSPSDVASDVLTWQEAAFLEVLSSVGPYSTWPEKVKQILLFASSIVGSAFSLQGSSFYYQWAPLIPHVFTRLLLNKADDTPEGWIESKGLDIVVTGHSLGGGLSSWAGEYNYLESVSFSGPGIALTSPKMRYAVEGGLSTVRGTKSSLSPPYGGSLFRTLEYEQSLVIIPDLDVVPRVDEHLGTVQNIKCMNGKGKFARTSVGCHGIVRTCCELRRSCGDAFNRTLIECSQWEPPPEA